MIWKQLLWTKFALSFMFIGWKMMIWKLLLGENKIKFYELDHVLNVELIHFFLIVSTFQKLTRLRASPIFFQTCGLVMLKVSRPFGSLDFQTLLVLGPLQKLQLPLTFRNIVPLPFKSLMAIIISAIYPKNKSVSIFKVLATLVPCRPVGIAYAYRLHLLSSLPWNSFLTAPMTQTLHHVRFCDISSRICRAIFLRPKE